MKAPTLFPNLPRPNLTHKGTRKGRKTARPLARKQPIHLILKSHYILLTHRRWIEERIKAYGARFGIRIYHQAICGDHIHFAIEICHADYYKKFIRALTGVLARKMGRGLWALLPFTRVAQWGADFRNLLAYIERNREETAILRRYVPRARTKTGGRNTSPAILSPVVSGLP